MHSGRLRVVMAGSKFRFNLEPNTTHLRYAVQHNATIQCLILIR